MKILKIEDPQEKSRICERILRSLPQWFGIESAILDYIKDVQAMETWVATKSDAIGFISLNKHNNQTAEIHVMGVLPEFHGKKVGSELVRVAEESLLAQRFKFLTVKTLSESRPDVNYDKTRKFYLKSGFIPLEEFKTLWGEHNPCLMMVKAIALSDQYEHAKQKTATHQFNQNMISDDLFVAGALKYLVIGNECRLLDKRRTPGFIESIDMDGGFFRWKISDFEDKGKFWDVEFERANAYQFKKDSAELTSTEVDEINLRVVALDKCIDIAESESNKFNTKKSIASKVVEIESWLNRSSKFFNTTPSIDFQSLHGPQLLREDFNRFISDVGMAEMEERTANTQVLNPHSGDWIKAMQIVMAEMGLKTYRGRDVRSSGAFSGIGTKENRRRYIEYRLGFIRTVLSRIGLREVELYRGMSTEWEWRPDAARQYRYWSSWTFNFKVAADFSELKPGSKHKNSYLIKRAIPVEQLFMTFLETEAMNRQYLESEALVLHEDDDRMLW